VSDSTNDQGASPENAADAEMQARAKSIGEVASPLLAGFSFTNVIVIVVSGDSGHFRWPGEAIIFWTITSIAFIASVQFAKYVAGGTTKSRRNWRRTEFFYHFGVVAFLLGFGFALAPHHSSGSSPDPYTFRCAASIVAFAACATWAIVYGIRGWNAWQKSSK
jgi:hypothetical protein